MPAMRRTIEAVGMEKSRLSARSNMPPWPGIRLEKSLMSIMRFTQRGQGAADRTLPGLLGADVGHQLVLAEGHAAEEPVAGPLRRG